MSNKVIIVGGGPSGLFCAYALLEKGFQVDLYDQMSGVGKKFLVAGNGGLNLTHSEDIDIFATRYGKNEKLFQALLAQFSPMDLRGWCAEIGVDTFVGSSGRVFPDKFKAADILLKWIEKLKSYPDFQLKLNHRLTSFDMDKKLTFDNVGKTIDVQAEKIVFGLGGASWEKTGSDGLWKVLFEKLNIQVAPFVPMNCGFERPWSEHFISKIDHTPLKNVSLTIGNRKVKGEIMLTPFGIEGGGVYALSDLIRDTITDKGSAVVTLDLKPDLTKEGVLEKLKIKKPKDSISNYLRKTLHLDRPVSILLRELSDADRFDDVNYLVDQIKNLEIELFNTRPLSEAISTGGGVCFSGLSDELEVKALPGVYVIGEMLDFEATTGGYLLQGCFSTGWRVAQAIFRS